MAKRMLLTGLSGMRCAPCKKMEKRTKIIVVVVVCALGATWFLWLPVTFMIAGGLWSSFATSITPDREYIKKASQNPTVRQYIDSYPDHTYSQHNEFLGWREIHFGVPEGPSLLVKVSNLHGGIRVSAACPAPGEVGFHSNATLVQQIVAGGCR